ncbi:hypothetical protein IE53DRAFT_386924 [Violaceomyces palustris]|uniref:Uncharacterized protein n=1 Tax=Violaceomyces palustris TaxID=1673888 RepID=A0ACD0NY33_9BASI|nr:hypothetical protein IE53DRAFT_386924 [Violaceomyces palustris]
MPSSSFLRPTLNPLGHVPPLVSSRFDPPPSPSPLATVSFTVAVAVAVAVACFQTSRCVWSHPGHSGWLSRSKERQGARSDSKVVRRGKALVTMVVVVVVVVVVGPRLGSARLLLSHQPPRS